jgi:hypothetical protein
MTPEERALVDELFSRLAGLENTARDANASADFQGAFGKHAPRAELPRISRNPTCRSMPKATPDPKQTSERRRPPPWNPLPPISI